MTSGGEGVPWIWRKSKMLVTSFANFDILFILVYLKLDFGWPQKNRNT